MEASAYAIGIKNEDVEEFLKAQEKWSSQSDQNRIIASHPLNFPGWEGFLLEA